MENKNSTKNITEHKDNDSIYTGPSYHLSYYKKKQEDFSITEQSKWKVKQKNVFHILNAIKPSQVLDLGACTGWFSILAEKLGAHVIATDIDKKIIAPIIEYAQKYNANITPLLLPFQDLVKMKEKYKKKLQQKQKSKYFYKEETITLLQSDVVLCLALIHHLVFFNNLSLEQILETLATLTKNTLVLEFVSDKDQNASALSNPSFFADQDVYEKLVARYQSYKKYYRLETVLETSKKYFSSSYTLKSHPETRTLIVFKK